MFFEKAVLMRGNEAINEKEVEKAGGNDGFKNFGAGTGERDWSVIVGVGKGAFFVFGGDYGMFPFGWKGVRVEEGLEKNG